MKNKQKRHNKDVTSSLDSLFKSINTNAFSSSSSSSSSSSPSPRTLIARATRLKEEGNEEYKRRRYSHAIDKYTNALTLVDTGSRDRSMIDLSVVALCNRANAYTQLRIYDRALADGERAIGLDDKSFKAYFRCGAALLGLRRFLEAQIYFQRSLKLCTEEATRLEIKKMIIQSRQRVLEAAGTSDTTPLLDDNMMEILFPEVLGIDGWWRHPTLSVSQVFERRLAKKQAKKIEQKKSADNEKDDDDVINYAINDDNNDDEDDGIDYVTDAEVFAVPDDDGYDGMRLAWPLTLEQVRGMIDLFRSEKTLHPRYAAEIILAAHRTFREEPALVDVAVPAGGRITICGDLHGQYYDLLHIFELNGLPGPENPYLFNGDLVDRGSFSCEVLLTLFAFRALYPSSVFISRGNHEANSMNILYGFSGEMEAKYHKSLDCLASEVFCSLPIAHLINGEVFVVHGGIATLRGSDGSGKAMTLDAIRALDRFSQPPESDDPMSLLLWSDPQDERGCVPSKRGVGMCFGPDVTEAFMRRNGVNLVIRSHEMKMNGYEVHHDGRLVTVFSAPNYCDKMGNLGAYLVLKAPGLAPIYNTFECSHHPADIYPMQYVDKSIRYLASLISQ